VTPDELAEQLHHLVDQLARPQRTQTIQPGDLVQIANDADDAYSGLPGIVQRIHGPRVHVSILTPHRGGLAFPFPLALLSRIGTVRLSRSFGEWARDLDKSCADCKAEMRKAFEDTHAQRRPAARETSPLVRVKKAG
jgi:hypothetical protein